MDLNLQNQFDSAKWLFVRQMMKLATVCVDKCKMLNNLRRQGLSQEEMQCFAMCQARLVYNEEDLEDLK